jgi:ubiquinone/menaquinone biosynthesis C-methylase UbiE
MHNTSTAESYIVNRYKLWRRWPTHWGYKHAKGARIARIIEETGGLPKLAVEIGVGPGGVAAALSRSGITVVGLDLSPDALTRAREHCKQDPVHLMRASGFSLPFQDASVDVIYASQVLHLFDSPGRAQLMREALRTLKPAGRFVFDMKNVSSHPVRYFGSTPERKRRNFPGVKEILSLLEQAGFGSVKMRPGLLPVIKSANVPNNGLMRALAHTTFFVAQRPH